MSEKEFLEILTDVFHEFEIKTTTYSKYDKDYNKFYQYLAFGFFE